MKKNHYLLIGILAVAPFLLVACNKKVEPIAPVSGKITYKGAPVPDLIVTFKRQMENEDYTVRFWSVGVTNEQGEYTLLTQSKENGAMVGKHDVSFLYRGGGEDEMETLQDALSAAKQALADGSGTDAEVAVAEQAIAELEKKLQARPPIADNYRIEFEVPKEGSNQANFDLKNRRG